MPYAIDLPIGGDDPPSRRYRALYANLLRWIDAADPALAAALHDRPVRKPFTISAIRRRHGNEWRWRVTLLEDDLWDALWAGVRTVAALDVDGRAWPVRWPDARVTHRSYGDLITNVQTQTHMEMRFLSPTTFRAGELDLHLPDPGAVFQSWLSRWNDFAPPRRRIDPDLMDVVRARVAIARIAKLRTQVHDLGRNKIGGFVGRVTFVITRARRLNQAHVWQINALADYAQFCGTGRKTPQGMGQTRRVSHGR